MRLTVIFWTEQCVSTVTEHVAMLVGVLVGTMVVVMVVMLMVVVVVVRLVMMVVVVRLVMMVVVVVVVIPVMLVIIITKEEALCSQDDKLILYPFLQASLTREYLLSKQAKKQRKPSWVRSPPPHLSCPAGSTQT